MHAVTTLLPARPGDGPAAARPPGDEAHRATWRHSRPTLAVLVAPTATMPTLVGLRMTTGARMLAAAAARATRMLAAAAARATRMRAARRPTRVRVATTDAGSGRGVVLNLPLGLGVRRLSMRRLVVHRGLMARRAIRMGRGRQVRGRLLVLATLRSRARTVVGAGSSRRPVYVGGSVRLARPARPPVCFACAVGMKRVGRTIRPRAIAAGRAGRDVR